MAQPWTFANRVTILGQEATTRWFSKITVTHAEDCSARKASSLDTDSITVALASKSCFVSTPEPWSAASIFSFTCSRAPAEKGNAPSKVSWRVGSTSKGE